MEEKEDPRLSALKADQDHLKDLMDSAGWAVLEGMIRQVQRQATSTLKTEKEPQALFQAQGVLRSFETLWTSLEALRDADEETLKQMISETEGA